MSLRKTGENIIWGEAGWAGNMILAALRPVGAAYGAAARLRAGLYRRGVLLSREASAPVVSVGNITLGGSGKTPLVIELAREFSTKGLSPAVLTRGYGGSDRAISRVVLPGDEAGVVGDEALLIARALPTVHVVRGASRAEAARYAAERFDPGIYILDDGFGHLALKRDFDILVVDARRGFGNGRTFPAGPLREPLGALARADAIIIRHDDVSLEAKHAAPTQQNVIEKTARRYAPEVPILKMKAHAVGLAEEAGGEAIPLQAIENKRISTFSGIGNPASFDRSLTEIGLHAVAHLAYSDHHNYNEKDIAEIADTARLGAEVVLTTEKDLVKFPKGQILKLPLYALRIRMEVENFGWLMELITSRIKSRSVKEPKNSG